MEYCHREDAMLGDRPTEDSCSPASGVYTKKCVEVAKWSWLREEARARERRKEEALATRANERPVAGRRLCRKCLTK